jgi:hypothetical protein
MACSNTNVSSIYPTGISDIEFVSTEPTEQNLFYAIFYNEGAGYLHVRTLGQGSQGTAVLVHSLADAHLYVRKVEKLNDVPVDTNNRFCNTNTGDAPGGDTPGQESLRPKEVSQYRPFSTIPGLVDFMTLNHNPPVTQNRNVKQHITFWQFCNGGDLADYITEHGIMGELIPEICIWRCLWQLFKAFQFLQNAQPPVSHRDILPSNIFVHWPEASKPEDASSPPDELARGTAADLRYYVTYPEQEIGDMPDFYLGDFGFATSYYRTPAIRLTSYLGDLDAIIVVFKQLAVGRSTAQEITLIETLDGLTRYSADMTDIFQEINALRALVSLHEPVGPVDLQPLDEFIMKLGKMYPKTYTNPTIAFTRPQSVSRPHLFDSKEMLLSRYGSTKGGPWYICTINANEDIKILDEIYGMPNTEPPPGPSALTIRNPDGGRSANGSVVPTTGLLPHIPRALPYYPSPGSSDPEDSSEESWSERQANSQDAIRLNVPVTVNTEFETPEGRRVIPESDVLRDLFQLPSSGDSPDNTVPRDPTDHEAGVCRPRFSLPRTPVPVDPSTGNPLQPEASVFTPHFPIYSSGPSSVNATPENPLEAGAPVLRPRFPFDSSPSPVRTGRDEPIVEEEGQQEEQSSQGELSLEKELENVMDEMGMDPENHDEGDDEDMYGDAK